VKWIKAKRLLSLICASIEKPCEINAYEPVLSSRALATLLSLTKKKQKQLADILFGLASTPTQPGDYRLPDDSGREIQYLLIGNYVTGYWPDHAMQELRIVEMDRI
jgi:hypothetical protein